MCRYGVDLVLAQMDYTCRRGGWLPALERALEGLTAAEAAWSPGEGIHTIWQLVNHLTFWKELCSRRLNGAPLTGKRIDNAATFGPPGDPDDEPAWRAAVARLYDAHRTLEDRVTHLSDRDLDRPLPGETTPLRELLLGLNLHDAYHLGQIVLIRKLRCAWPGGG